MTDLKIVMCFNSNSKRMFAKIKSALTFPARPPEIDCFHCHQLFSNATSIWHLIVQISTLNYSSFTPIPNINFIIAPNEQFAYQQTGNGIFWKFRAHVWIHVHRLVRANFAIFRTLFQFLSGCLASFYWFLNFPAC